MMLNFFDAESISRANIRKAPAGFCYGFIENIFREDVYQKLIAHFPDTKQFKLVDKQSGGGHKRFYTGLIYDASKRWGCVCDLRALPSPWMDVVQESASPAFITLLSNVTGVVANTMCTFGFTYGNEGSMQEVHVDGAVREYDASPIHSTLACLLYFNKNPDTIGGTCVYASDKKTVLFQAPHLRNGLIFFEQHPEAWHGFPVMPKGAERHLVSLAYSNEKKSIALKTGLAHRLTCKQFFKSYLR